MITPHDRLTGVPGTPLDGWTGRWAQADDHVLDQAGGSACRDTAESDDLDAVTSLEDHLAEAVQSGSWLLLTTVPLLARHDDDALDLVKREHILEANLASIAHICERFVTRLGERAELLPVSRVKRPARRALERMSAHTEDWAARTLAGPVPRRALAVTREHDPDLYENRMVTELVHPILSSALASRIRQLQRLTTDLADLERTKDEGTPERRIRLYAFWGADAARATESSARAEGAIAKLEAMAARVQSLRGSTLGMVLRGRRTGQRSLRITNVIANDRHYRAAGLVWRAYEREPDADISPEERKASYLSRHRAFDNYAFGLVTRSLDNLRYTPTEDELPAAGIPLTLRGPWGEAEFLRHHDGSMVVSSHGTSTRFVPLTDTIGPNDDDLAIASRWESVTDAVMSPTVVLYLAASVEVRKLPPRVAHPMMSAGPDVTTVGGPVWGVPVSPLETTSLERVSRAVAIAVQSPALRAYPREIRLAGERIPRRLIECLLSANLTQRGLSPLFHSADPDTLAVRRPLAPSEWTALDGVVRQLTDRTRSPGWEKDFARPIGELSSAIANAAESVAPLLNCPLCPQRADASEIEREGDVFSVTCRSCGSRWGLERCGSCTARIPIIEPERSLRNPEVDGPGWVERIYGQDALASPCWARTTPGKYVCTECGACPESATAGEACARCAPRQ
ncbi:hypothetical protein LT337_09920 [Mycolicibacterium fortuitum]|nr:hypothetical protein LT337_09920 [Mycolicibacterium fortuitum]